MSASAPRRSASTTSSSTSRVLPPYVSVVEILEAAIQRVRPR